MSRSRRFRAHLLGLAVALSGALPLAAHAAQCAAPGQWQVAGETRATNALMAELAKADVVLLGEQHDRMDHHRWQLHTLAALHAHRPNMAIGLEMLPREAQPALDAWVAGELDEREFLAQSEWRQAWGFNPELYLPILHFARMQRLPLLALNVTPALRGRLASDGWEAVPEQERFGITPPAPAPPVYRAALEAVFARHVEGDSDPAALERFIAAQLIWDRAMATALADAAANGTLVAGLMGHGHLANGDGVPHQLDALGLDNHRSLLTWSPGPDCTPPRAQADAFYALGDEAPFQLAPPARLEVMIGKHPDGVRIQRIAPDSVAASNDLAEGDVILTAAGVPVATPADLTAVVARQAPGTLLPLTLQRDGERQEVQVRFPAAAP